MKKLLPKFLLILGGILLVITMLLIIQHYSSTRLSFSSVSVSSADHSSKIVPKDFIIDRIAINLPVIPSHISKDTWETTDKGVSYLVSSPLPGEKGNSIFYGHNWTSLLGNLVKVRVGDQISIHFSDSSKKTFKVVYTGVVNPTDTYVLKNTDNAKLTVYTCTGFLDSKRFVAVASLIEK